MTTCIGCGCDEGTACNVAGEACAWVALSPRRLAGLCSGCLELYPASDIAEELVKAEWSLEVYGDTVPQGMMFDPPARAPGQLILPGDEEFHL